MPALRTGKFRFDWKLTVLVLILLPILLRLGFWQLAREAEKLQLQTSYTERQQEQPLALDLLDTSSDLQYRQVRMDGEYDNAHIFLLDNKIYQGQVGFEVVEPFITDTGLTVLINRGWIAQGRDRSALPQVQEISGKVQLAGSVYVPVGEQFTLGDISPGADWPKIIQSLDVQELAGLAGVAPSGKIFPYSVRLAETAAGVLERSWTVISTTPEKHRGYAVQWFAMAAVLILLYFYSSMRPLGKAAYEPEPE